MASMFWTKKPTAARRTEAGGPAHGLRRALGAFDLTMLGLGAVLGAGLFADLISFGPEAVLSGGQFIFSGRTAGHYAGPAVFGSFVLAGVGMLVIGLCYAEMAAMFPAAGGAYAYTYAALGPFVAGLVGWDLILEYLAGAMAVASGWSAYVVRFLSDLDVLLPPRLTASPFSMVPLEDGRWVPGLFNLPALLVVVAVTAVLLVGIKESANFNVAAAGVKLSALLIFLIAGVVYIQPENWTPWLPPNQGPFGAFGWSGLVRGAGAVFFAYMGFDAVATVTEETRRPARAAPWGLLGGLAFALLMYVAIALILTGNMPYTKLNGPDPMYTVIDESTKLVWLVPFIRLGAAAGLLSLLTVLLLGHSRVLLALARAGWLWPALAKIHPRAQTPYAAIWVTGALTALGSALIPISVVGTLAAAGLLWALLAVCASALRWRYARPDIPRPFRIPFGPGMSVLGMMVCLAAGAMIPRYVWGRWLLWMLAGLGIYLVYGKRAISEGSTPAR